MAGPISTHGVSHFGAGVGTISGRCRRAISRLRWIRRDRPQRRLKATSASLASERIPLFKSPTKNHLDLVFELNCPRGPLRLRTVKGRMSDCTIARLAEWIEAEIERLCRAWRKIHG